MDHKCFVCRQYLPVEAERRIPIGDDKHVCSAVCFERAADEGVVTAEAGTAA